MASIPAQDEFLAVTRKSQEAMITAIKTWVETVRTATPRFMSVYAPLTDNLPKLPSVTLPLVDKLPAPKDAVASAYDLAELLLASQRKFAEDVLKAMAPPVADRSENAPKSVSQSPVQAPSQSAVQAPSQSATRVPSQSATRGTAAGSEPKTTASPARKRTPAGPAQKGTTAS